MSRLKNVAKKLYFWKSAVEINVKMKQWFYNISSTTSHSKNKTLLQKGVTPELRNRWFIGSFSFLSFVTVSVFDFLHFSFCSFPCVAQEFGIRWSLVNAVFSEEQSPWTFHSVQVYVERWSDPELNLNVAKRRRGLGSGGWTCERDTERRSWTRTWSIYRATASAEGHLRRRGEHWSRTVFHSSIQSSLWDFLQRLHVHLKLLRLSQSQRGAGLTFSLQSRAGHRSLRPDWSDVRQSFNSLKWD